MTRKINPFSYIGFLCGIAVFVFWGVWGISHSKAGDTAPEVLKQRREMAKEIKTLKRGEFIVLKRSRVWIVLNDVPENGWIHYREHLEDRQAVTMFPDDMARHAVRVVKRDDFEWELCARKFLYGGDTVAAVKSESGGKE